MIIDNKGKLFGKINILDLSVVVVILLAAFLCFAKFSSFADKSINSGEKQVVYTLKAKAIRQLSCDAIEIGDKLYDKETNAYIGTIIEKRQEPATEYVNMVDGSITKKAEIPNKYDLYFDVECSAEVNDNGYYMSGTKEIATNGALNVYTNKIEVSVTVMNINE